MRARRKRMTNDAKVRITPTKMCSRLCWNSFRYAVSALFVAHDAELFGVGMRFYCGTQNGARTVAPGFVRAVKGVVVVFIVWFYLVQISIIRTCCKRSSSLFTEKCAASPGKLQSDFSIYRTCKSSIFREISLHTKLIELMRQNYANS